MTKISKTSTTTNQKPSVSQLESAELSMNTTDGKIFYKKEVSGVETIVEVTDTRISTVVPVGTTAQRPSPPEIGMIRFNTTTDRYEGYRASGWVDFH